jgi:predicted RNA-binding Zn-ribbon protein involved in translation (DUF1610 family)
MRAGETNTWDPVLYYRTICLMTSAIRYSGTSGADPGFTCPVCNKLIILNYTNTTKKAGVAFQCPYCYEWLRFDEVSGNKPPNLSEEETKRWQVLELIRLDKNEVEKISQRKTNTEIFEWEA